MTHMIRIALLLLLTLTKGSYASDSATIDTIKQVISDQVGIPISQIDEDKLLSKQSIPADALDCYEIIMGLEEKLRISIPDESIEIVIGPYEPKPGLAPSEKNSFADKLTVNKLVQILELTTKQ